AEATCQPVRSGGQRSLSVDPTLSVGRHKLLQREVIPLFWGDTCFRFVLALYPPNWTLPAAQGGGSGFFLNGFPGRYGSAVRHLAGLLRASRSRGGGGRRARHRHGQFCTGGLAAVRRVRGADQLRVCAELDRVGRDMVCAASTATAGALAGSGQSGLRTG